MRDGIPISHRSLGVGVRPMESRPARLRRVVAAVATRLPCVEAGPALRPVRLAPDNRPRCWMGNRNTDCHRSAPDRPLRDGEPRSTTPRPGRRGRKPRARSRRRACPARVHTRLRVIRRMAHQSRETGAIGVRAHPSDTWPCTARNRYSPAIPRARAPRVTAPAPDTRRNMHCIRPRGGAWAGTQLGRTRDPAHDRPAGWTRRWSHRKAPCARIRPGMFDHSTPSTRWFPRHR